MALNRLLAVPVRLLTCVAIACALPCGCSFSTDKKLHYIGKKYVYGYEQCNAANDAADEIINILHVISVVFHLSEDILGLTVFALGNSVGDFI